MARGALAALILTVCACKDRAPPPPPDLPRPVTVMELTDGAPLRPVRAPGSVVAWREDDVAFEVSGQIIEMAELGANLLGRWEEGGKTLRDGQVLARINPEPYKIALDLAEADVQVAKERLASARVQLEKVLPAQQKAADAQLRRAKAEYERNEEAFRTNAVSQVDLIRAEADRDTRDAKVQELAAEVEQQKAQIAILAALVEEKEEAQRQAQYDFDRCTLHAPFNCEVSRHYAVAGGYARTGERVAHLIMMDPVKIDVAVSAESAERVTIGDSVFVYLPGDSEPTLGAVFEKGSTADPETRTFRISIFARNWRHIAKVPAGDPRLEHPRIERFQFAARERERTGEGPVLIEEKRALRKDAEGNFVWVMVGLKRDSAIRTGQLIEVRKVRVKPTDYLINMQGIMRFRGIEPTTELDDLSVIAWDVPEGFEGTKVLFAQEQWKLRPGQVVTTILERQVPQPGLWVPLRALATEGEKEGRVYAVEQDTVRVVHVRITESVGEFFRIEPVDEAGRELVKPGARLIVDYIHFLGDGERVKVTKTVRIKS
ncbi:MAG: HlyD family secretion protein [Planctomycetota bacterium]|jgi:multidrug resistance efflux pump